MGTPAAGVDDGTECVLVGLLLPGFWITGGRHSSAMVYVHGGDVSAGHVVPFATVRGPESKRSFSFLYLANVIGAVAGAIAPLFLIELYGFRGTMRVGTVCNVIIAVSAFALTLGRRAKISPEPPVSARGSDRRGAPDRYRSAEGCAGPALSDRAGNDGHGSDLDQAVHAICWSGRLLVCVHS